MLAAGQSCQTPSAAVPSLVTSHAKIRCGSISKITRSVLIQGSSYGSPRYFCASSSMCARAPAQRAARARVSEGQGEEQ